MFRLGLIVALGICLAPAPAAGEQKPPLPPHTLFTFKSDPTPREREREKTVALQLQVRQQDFFERDRSSFNRDDEVIFITPTNRPPVRTPDKTKVLFGVVIRF